MSSGVIASHAPGGGVCAWVAPSFFGVLKLEIDDGLVFLIPLPIDKPGDSAQPPSETAVRAMTAQRERASMGVEFDF